MICIDCRYIRERPSGIYWLVPALVAHLPAMAPDPWGYVETLFYQYGIRQALRGATRLAAISQATKDEIGTLDPAAYQRTRVALLGVAPEFRPLEGADRDAILDRVRTKWVPGS